MSDSTTRSTDSGIPIKPVYVATDLPGADTGTPGQFPKGDERL